MKIHTGLLLVPTLFVLCDGLPIFADSGSHLHVRGTFTNTYQKLKRHHLGFFPAAKSLLVGGENMRSFKVGDNGVPEGLTPSLKQSLLDKKPVLPLTHDYERAKQESLASTAFGVVCAVVMPEEEWEKTKMAICRPPFPPLLTLPPILRLIIADTEGGWHMEMPQEVLEDLPRISFLFFCKDPLQLPSMRQGAMDEFFKMKFLYSEFDHLEENIILVDPNTHGATSSGSSGGSSSATSSSSTSGHGPSTESMQPLSSDLSHFMAAPVSLETFLASHTQPAHTNIQPPSSGSSSSSSHKGS